MANFSLLFGSIIRSSIWVKESKETRLVWVTLLALKDGQGEVMSSRVGLADAAKVTLEECEAALKVLMGPDPYDTSGVLDGKRIVEIPGGWKIVNHERYQFGSEARRQYWRLKKAAKRGKPISGELAAIRALERGDEGEFDRLSGEPGVDWKVKVEHRFPVDGDVEGKQV